MAAMLSLGAWAAQDLALDVAQTVAFGDWGFSNEAAPTINLGNWAAGGGWQFAPALSQDSYCGVDIAFNSTTETHVTFMICYEGGAEQDIDVPTGSTGIKADFAYSGGITKIGFKYGDWEATANENGATISITKAVVKANSTGDVVELAFADLDDDTKDEANKAITLNRYASTPSWTFTPALSSGDYEKVVVTFAETIPEEGLTLRVNGEDVAGLVCGATKVTYYFSAGVSIESIGFFYGWNSKQGDTDEAPSATLKIAKAELVKNVSGGSTDPAAPKYAVNIDEAIANGSVAADYTAAAKGATVTLTPIPDSGYQLSRLIIEALADASEADARRKAPPVGYFIAATEQADGTWTFEMPDRPVLVSAQFEDKPEEPIYLTASKLWTTYYSPETYTVPEGLKAYIVTSLTMPEDGESGTIVVEESQVIARNTPMLILNESFATTTMYRLYATDDQTVSGSAFEFKGVDADTVLPNDGKMRYVLVDGVFVLTEGGTLPANTCYLEFSTSASARRFTIVISDESSTAIEAVEGTPQGEGTWYDLRGHRVTSLKKGIYIKDGRKIMVK